ncbi:MAG: hypothetical protein ACP5T5_00810 [Thermoprotei archaeon]|nr:hypothetical protein [TACK group archaeon]
MSEFIRVSISVRDRLVQYVVEALRPDEDDNVSFVVSGDLLTVTAAFKRDAKARAWIESEARIISTILKTLNQSLL